jgi:hypothetical protein
MAALNYLRTLPDVQPNHVGLWGESQGPWVIAKAAAAFPHDVAFIISVSGSGVSVVEEQLYNIEAHSRDAGMSGDDIKKAVLFGRLLIDWQLSEPIFREVNEEDAESLNEGPWSRFLTLVYESGETSPAEGLQMGIERTLGEISLSQTSLHTTVREHPSRPSGSYKGDCGTKSLERSQG